MPDDELIWNEPDVTFVVVRNPGFVVAPEYDTNIYEFGVHTDVDTFCKPLLRRVVPIIGATPDVT